MNIPNILTLIRIGCIPLLVVVFYLPFSWSHWVAALLFGLASITDWFDGYLARKLNQSTPFGAFLDPVADKLMVAVALGLLIELYCTPMMTLPALVIIGREIVISALREWMAEIGKRASVSVSYIGKLKTTLQMVSIFILLAFTPGTSLAMAGIALLYGAALLTLWSMWIYLRAAWPELTRSM
ncbi:CDP-diacylglycerol--glycerol-3-phosphate 3-phosphatidyltransferase [Larsenimonas rhizosphaerae]|uniref:CDP-diacylglycerol--glycerol-3-phosphate 3-phosphatidyltransferase n=1 Tax=Larsenimonas rhizosphaerae TaxID=2944682 RepID=A0AA42CX85_9GAMM|nr:CDP-diacylglycerol--glycerol-3-phosphate 3-phosphatidyltransferase [Larsenimonas rhizosphaerae]MCM2130891.1 CDP-diacylglycerol--glycerol-3-phosphate 3-phosphatidyltransferase [Larsenimonas rhizosphaerae]MCX2523595.1 CDP-diacylglycerol--glycerol-3-phosphate 3-phosphatidyltransferase [Larsenimonas rhizosphaerae]